MSRNANAIPKSIGQQLLQVVENNNMDVAKFMLEKQGAKINAVSDINKLGLITPLAYAAYLGRSNMVSFLLEAGAIPVKADSKKNIPLELAVHEGHERVVKILLAQYTPEEKNQVVSSQLLVAAKKGHPQMIGVLLNHGADINTQESGGLTPLMCAINSDKIEAALALLNAPGIDINARAEHGSSAAPIAARRLHPDILLRLLNHEAYQFQAEDMLLNCLTRAMFDHANDGKPLEKMAEAVKTLLDKGADANGIDTEGKTPLSLLCRGLHPAIGTEVSSCLERVIKVLLRHHADPNQTPKGDDSALIQAFRSNRVPVAQLLLQHGAHVNQKDLNGNSTPLLLAVARWHFVGGTKINKPNIELVQLALRHGANPDEPNTQGLTPLYYAISGFFCCDHRSSTTAKAENKAVAFMLLDKGANFKKEFTSTIGYTQMLNQELNIFKQEYDDNRKTFLNKIKNGTADDEEIREKIKYAGDIGDQAMVDKLTAYQMAQIPSLTTQAGEGGAGQKPASNNTVTGTSILVRRGSTEIGIEMHNVIPSDTP